MARAGARAKIDIDTIHDNGFIYDIPQERIHRNEQRSLFFLLPDELRELFAPMIDKAIDTLPLYGTDSSPYRYRRPQ